VCARKTPPRNLQNRRGGRKGPTKPEFPFLGGDKDFSQLLTKEGNPAPQRTRRKKRGMSFLTWAATQKKNKKEKRGTFDSSRKREEKTTLKWKIALPETAREPRFFSPEGKKVLCAIRLGTPNMCSMHTNKRRGLP